MKILACAIVGAGLVFAATPATADILTVVYTGTVATGIDSTGVFGLAGQSLAGMGYTATYRFDDTLGSRTTIAPYLDSVIGGAYNGDTSPSLGAVLTINALSFRFNGSNLGLQSNYPLDGQISSYASDLATSGAFDASLSAIR